MTRHACSPGGSFPGSPRWCSGRCTSAASYFFLRAARANEWHTVGGGFIPVGLFASLMGVATITHWDKFIHTNVAFWLWAALYFTTPFLVFAMWLLNRREQSPSHRRGSTALAAAPPCSSACSASRRQRPVVFLFLVPSVAIAIWPWTLTELTARVMGAIFALGVAGLGAFTDKRWTSMRILLQVAAVMLVLVSDQPPFGRTVTSTPPNR